MGVHPVSDASISGTHNLSFYCDDIADTVKGMRERGVEFDDEVADHGYGFVTHFTMPGGAQVQLYQPKYQKRSARPKAKAPARKSAARKAAPAKKKAPVKKKSTAKKPAAKKAAPKTKAKNKRR